MTLALEKHLHVAEIYVSAPRTASLRATEEAEGDLLEALDLAVDNIQNQGGAPATSTRTASAAAARPAQAPLARDVLESGSVAAGVPR